MEPNAPTEAQPTRTRRPRPTTACIGCRSRRVKCDRAKPACSECKRHGRACDIQRGTVSYHIVLDPHVESVTAPPDSLLPSNQNTSTNASERGKTPPSQGISVSPFWTLANSNTQIEKDISWIHNVIIPQNEADAALDHDIISAFTRCMPPQEKCKSLIQSFLLNINPLVPLGINSFLVEDLVVSKPTFLLASSPCFLSLVLAVLYSGAVAAPSLLTFEQMKMIHIVYERLVDAVNSSSSLTTTSTLQFLQGYVTINSVRASRRDPLSEYEFVAHAIRMAQSIKPQMSSQVDDPLQIKINQQIWWYLDVLDVEATLAIGVPGLIQSDGYETSAPSITWAFSDMANERAAFESCPQHTSSMATAMRGRFELAKRLQTWTKSAPSDEETTSFVSFINNLLESVPEAPDTEWPRLYLSLQIDRMWCIYHPQATVSTSDCEDGIMRSARAFLERYYRIATLLSKPNYQWYLPGLSQSLHALMIALMHLSTCPHLAVETNLREIVDKIFALRVLRDVKDATIVARAIVRKDDGLEAGNPMYCLLWSMRRRVWEKAGWEIPPSEQFTICHIPPTS